ncbi:MAG: glycosyltransferase, partial [Blastocatellia bacterium]
MSDPRKLRVLHVGKFYPPYMGGIETHLQNLCNELRDLVDLKVLVSNSSTQTIEETVEGVSVTRVGTRATLSAAPISPGLVSRIRREAADIVHLHHPNPIAVMAYLMSGHRGKMVITYHSDIVRQKALGRVFQPFLDRSLAWADAIIATSPNYLATSTVLQAHRDRCEVLPYGIPVEQFANRDEAAIARLRERYGSRVVITVGRLIYYKGFDVLVRAMKDVNGTLLVVGDGPLRAELEAQALSLGISDRVHFLGEIHNRDIAAYYHASDVFALASVARSEAFGIVQLEAMACGLPVVNTGLDSGVPFVSLDGLTGLTVPPGDSVALSRALNKLLDDDELRGRLGDAARKRVDTEFTAPVMGRRMLDLYTSLVGRGESGR